MSDSQGHQWPEPSARMLVVFCSECRQYLGIRDVDRMRHEHFERSERCRHGHYLAAVYGQEGTTSNYGVALRAMASGVPAVPCDAAAVERAREAVDRVLCSRGMNGYDLLTRELAEAVLRAAGAQQDAAAKPKASGPDA